MFHLIKQNQYSTDWYIYIDKISTFINNEKKLIAEIYNLKLIFTTIFNK